MSRPAAIRLTRRRLEVLAGDDGLEALAAMFARQHVVALPGFLADDLLDSLDQRLPSAPFSPRVEHGVELEHRLEDPAILSMVDVTLNDPALFALVDRLTRCGPIGCFTGRVYRRVASSGLGHYYPWHSDNTDDRLIGVSINLGADAHEGGALQVRRADTHDIVAEVNNTTRGDAVLFRISSALEHQVTPVTGAAPRVVLAGWFRRQPDFWADVRSSEVPHL